MLSTVKRLLRAPLVGVHVAAAILVAAAPTAAAGPGQVPFKETLTLEGLSPDRSKAYYAGTATHMGAVEATEYFNRDFDPADPDSVFATYTKVTANGDEVYGRIIPDDPLYPFTTGVITIDGGTGLFAGAVGASRYVVSENPTTKAITARIVGTISRPGGK